MVVIKATLLYFTFKAQGQMCNSEICGFQFGSISCTVIVQAKMDVAI